MHGVYLFYKRRTAAPRAKRAARSGELVDDGAWRWARARSWSASATTGL